MVVTNRRERFHFCYLSIESLCNFLSLKTKRIAPRHITSSVANKQRGRSTTKTKVGWSRSIHLPQRAIIGHPKTIVNLLEYKLVVGEQEDYTGGVLAIERIEQKTTKTESLNEPVKAGKYNTSFSTQKTTSYNVICSLLVYNTNVDSIFA